MESLVGVPILKFIVYVIHWLSYNIFKHILLFSNHKCKKNIFGDSENGDLGREGRKGEREGGQRGKEEGGKLRERLNLTLTEMKWLNTLVDGLIDLYLCQKCKQKPIYYVSK